jgi:hypothetical protein
VPRDAPWQSDWLPPATPKPPKFQLEAFQEAEHELQIACTGMLWRILLPDVCWTAVDHAHSLNMTIGRHGRPIGLIEAQKRKARGVKAGIPDYLFWRKAQAYAIELKATADGVLSDHQEDFLKAMIAAHAEVSICWTIDQVVERLTAWGLCRRTRVMA